VLHVRRQLLDRQEVFAGGRPAPPTVDSDVGSDA
jgi:hypothetical protein